MANITTLASFTVATILGQTSAPQTKKTDDSASKKADPGAAITPMPAIPTSATPPAQPPKTPEQIQAEKEDALTRPAADRYTDAEANLKKANKAFEAVAKGAPGYLDTIETATAEIAKLEAEKSKLATDDKENEENNKAIQAQKEAISKAQAAYNELVPGYFAEDRKAFKEAEAASKEARSEVAQTKRLSEAAKKFVTQGEITATNNEEKKKLREAFLKSLDDGFLKTHARTLEVLRTHHQDKSKDFFAKLTNAQNDVQNIFGKEMNLTPESMTILAGVFSKALDNMDAAEKAGYGDLRNDLFLENIRVAIKNTPR